MYYLNLNLHLYQKATNVEDNSATFMYIASEYVEETLQGFV